MNFLLYQTKLNFPTHLLYIYLYRVKLTIFYSSFADIRNLSARKANATARQASL